MSKKRRRKKVEKKNKFIPFIIIMLLSLLASVYLFIKEYFTIWHLGIFNVVLIIILVIFIFPTELAKKIKRETISFVGMMISLSLSLITYMTVPVKQTIFSKETVETIKEGIIPVSNLSIFFIAIFFIFLIIFLVRKKKRR